MCRYVVHLSGSLKYLTIQNYVSAVISLNYYFGQDISALRSEFEFTMTMSGIRRVLGDPEPIRPTLTLSQLLKMFSYVDVTSSNQRCMWACIALAFRALLRKSNLVPDSAKDMSGHYLRRGAIKFDSWGLDLKISSSKTIQYQQRVHSVPVTFSPGSPLCATSWVFRHLQETPGLGPDSPAFMLRGKSGLVPLTYSKLMTFLKSLLRSAGLSYEHTGMHSLRRAGALHMYDIGLSLEDIRQAGDWKSMAALLYLAKPLELRVKSDLVVTKSLLEALC